MFVDESGQYFYQNVDGTQQQMVVVSSDGGDASEGESGGAEGSVMLNAEEDSINDVRTKQLFWAYCQYCIYILPYCSTISTYMNTVLKCP